MTVAATPGFSSLTSLVEAFDHSRVGGAPCKLNAPPAQRSVWLNTRNRAIEGSCERQLLPTCQLLALHHGLAQANRNQYSQIQQIGRRMGIVDVAKLEIWGARTLAASTINGPATPNDVVQAFKLGEASQLLRRETLAPEQVTQLRQLASEVKPKDPRAALRAKQAEQMRQQQINQAANTQQSQPVQQHQQGPGKPSVGAGALVQPWSEERIRAAVNKLVQDNNLKSPQQIRMIEDVLINPNRSVLDRANALGGNKSFVIDSFKAIRARLKMDGSSLCEQLAQRVGMTSAELVARYEVPNEPGLAQRVISTVPESRRDEAAQVLLSYQTGGGKVNEAFVSLKAVFSENQMFSGMTTHSLKPFRIKFGVDRITMLQNMGFKNEQILRMNPASDELANRLDPKLGTYSGSELQKRKEMGLPTTREEASLLLLTVRTAPKAGNRLGPTLSHRNLLTLTVISDQPSYTSRDLQSAFEQVKPDIASKAAASDMSALFKAVESRYEISIERSVSTAALGREYQLQINTQMLKLFGVGKKSLSTGKLESIPTDFQPNLSPSPSARAEPGARRTKPKSSESDATTWRDLMPLLRPSAGGN